MAAASPAWLARLEHAATLGDIQAIDRLAAEVAGQQPDLAEGIARLARQFDHEHILAAIHRAALG